MQPRIVFRTHYQVDEPAYMEFLVKLCTSPVQSAYPEIVAQRLAREISSRGRDFNTAAGRYAVDLAKALGLVTANLTWTERGQLTDLIAEIPDGTFEEQLSLTVAEKLLHFRVYLEADGGALRHLARQFVESGRLPIPGRDWNWLAKDMFTTVYSEYLIITNNTADRVALRREIERIKEKGYEGKTGPHKLFAHLQVLCRLGLIEHPDSGGSRAYQVPASPKGTRTGIQLLVEELPDAFTLERVIKEHQTLELAARVLQLPCIPYGSEPTRADRERALALFARYYSVLTGKGVPLCPISTLTEAVQIDLLTKCAQLLRHTEAMELLHQAQKSFPKDVRFHVDRRGCPAFLKLSDQVLHRFARAGVAQ